MLGCANVVPSEPVEVTEDKVIGITYDITVEETIANDAVMAVDLLHDATGGYYNPTLTIGECDSKALCIREVSAVAECAGELEPWGCMRPSGVIDIWAGLHPEFKASVILHELGHTLGLTHEAGSVMNPERTWIELYQTCIGAAVLLELQHWFNIPVVTPMCLRKV